MLYKVTPMLAPPAKKKAAKEPGQPRKRRKSAVYDHEGHEVLITLMCLKCRQIKPLVQFGLRKMADGAIRNQPWCRGCRSGAGTRKPAPEAKVEAGDAPHAPIEAPIEAPIDAAAEAPLETASEAVEAVSESPVEEAVAPIEPAESPVVNESAAPAPPEG